jgi:signal transduction histidine kinase
MEEPAVMGDKPSTSRLLEDECKQTSSTQNEQLQRRINVLTRERELLAYEIHDGLLQELSSVSLLLEKGR